MLNFLLNLLRKYIFMSELKQPKIKILYIYRLNAIAKYWYNKMEEEKKISIKNSIVFFNRRLSVAEKLKKN